MKIQNIANPRFTQELTKKEWESLGKRQKLFRILDSKDSPAIKEQVIANSLGAKKPDPVKKK